MKKRLEINDIKEDTKIRLDITIQLNQMVLSLEKKDKSLQINLEFQRKYEIDTKTDIDEIIFNFYSEYVELKSIELFWEDKLKELSIVDIDVDAEN